MKRRDFLVVSGAAAGSVGLLTNPRNVDRVRQESPATQLDSDLVKRFVGVSHGNLKAVKELIDGEPMLINASWDWVKGDFETGLGAASHVGSREVASFLLDRGARINIFAMTMLGHTDMVKAVLAAYPNTHTVAGPHGIPLISHAIFGRDHADDVFELLIQGGADVNAASNSGQTVLMSAASVGRIGQVGQLLELGSDVGAKDKRERTAIDVAKSRKHDAVVKLLEQHSSK